MKERRRWPRHSRPTLRSKPSSTHLCELFLTVKNPLPLLKPTCNQMQSDAIKCQQPLTRLSTLACSLDGHPLQIKQLRGEEPVEAINLAGKCLTGASAIVIASLISSNTVTKSLECVPPPLMTKFINVSTP